MTQASASPLARPKVSPATIALIILVGIGAILLSAADLYTDVLWFDQLGYLSVLSTSILSQTGLFAAASVSFALITGLSLWLAYRFRPVYIRFPDEKSPFDQYRQLLDQLRRVVMIGVPLALGVLAGLAVSPSWGIVQSYLNRSPFGETDPEFGLDISFYIFELPFYTGLVGFLSGALLIGLILTAGVHIVYGSIKFNGRETFVSKAARIQIGLLAFLYLLAQGASLWLDQYLTMTSSSGLFTGATYADVNAAIPGLQILALISVVVALLFLLAAFIGKWRLPVIATGLMVVSSLVLGGLFPWAVQTFQVVPNERTLEAPFIDRNLAATRAGYGLDGVEKVNYNATTDATAGALREDAETTASIRIIDPALVSASFRQLEQFRQYYNFPNQLDVDRYEIDGVVQDTVLAVRELNQAGLGDSQSWYNNVIVYTHGYGVVAAYGNQRTVDGQPLFMQSGIPSTGKLGDYEPRVYFGESSPGYSIVGAPEGAEPLELDFPAGEGENNQTYNTFSGEGGPNISGIIPRLAYAMKFQSEQILLSDAINSDSQILYDRSPRDRVAAVAPYLQLDSDVYPAIVDGRLVWIVDGYTTSNNYPYSRSENLAQVIADSNSAEILLRGQVNYIRNSVKATVDAYDGKVNLYQWDEQDPVLKTWMQVFPDTVKPMSEMSGDLMAHVRYPADLFKVQRALLGSYHVNEAGAFYSQQDAWMTPNDPVGGQGIGTLQPPYYLTMQVPGTTAPNFSIYSTFIPRSTGESSRNVLTGYLVANADAGSEGGKKSADYGKLTLLTLPKSTIVPGPGQVQNNFNADSEVSRLLNILRQGSTRVLNGNLLTLPVGGGLLYVQPVYIQSTGETSFPLLQKILVAFGDQIAFEDTLDQALTSLFGSSGISPIPTPTDPVTEPTDPGNPAPPSANLELALQQALEAIQEKEAAMAAGDWTAFGKAEEKLRKAITAALDASR
ncbi:unannotated protein [freshwater metagenome]|uniref:Unannotated protein n=1 Tax=freshwater metagenome TaxID=449393 RepID=A0A6J6ILH8_9ZZZZ|nr:UPF0182 family protein [Actinomycetota bacterium]